MRSTYFGKIERAFVARIRGMLLKASLDCKNDSFDELDSIEVLRDELVSKEAADTNKGGSYH